MAELTKEEQVQAIYDLKVGYALGNADIAMLKSMARQLLASMEQEPVATLNSMTSENGGLPYGTIQFLRIPTGEERPGLLELYAAPRLPQPVPVDEDDNFYSWFGREWHEKYQNNQYTSAAKQMLGVMAESAWKAGRRAAMLQGAEPVQEWIPCSERMPEIEGHYLVWASASNLDGYCDHQAMATYQGGEWSNEFNWLVTHWMPMPAAPQQEADNG